jgi:hypothetical protein
MGTEALKSTPVTRLDATPPVRTTSGQGANGVLHHIDGTVTATTAMDAGSTYRLVRLPSNAIVKEVWACLDTAVTTFTADIGVYYSSGADTPPGTVAATAIDADLFASAVAFAAIVVPTQYTHEAAASAFAVADMFMPLWQAAGLTSDPNCGLDIVFTATATTDCAAGAIIYCAVKYVLPGA